MLGWSKVSVTNCDVVSRVLFDTNIKMVISRALPSGNTQHYNAEINGSRLLTHWCSLTTFDTLVQPVTRINIAAYAYSVKLQFTGPKTIVYSQR